MSHKNLRGKLTISRPRGNTDREYVQMDLTDESSGTRILTIRVGVAEFAETLFGLAFTECSFDLYPERVGKVRETKHELVPYAGFDRDEKKARAALAEFEIDGWQGDVRDMFNHHRRQPNGYMVLFTRYVDAPTNTTPREERE